MKLPKLPVGAGGVYEHALYAHYEGLSWDTHKAEKEATNTTGDELTRIFGPIPMYRNETLSAQFGFTIWTPNAEEVPAESVELVAA